MATIAGWKDILRPIRDGYRHLFPSPDTGPTPEERAKQRELDRLKGFAYFDTFDQLDEWTETTSDPLQRSNTPLLPRARNLEGNDVDTEKANVLICHDYAGNYHDYESSQGTGLDEESYTCEYLQFVDAFIYFSHKLCCVPPPSWTSTLHRNGVHALGTVLVEPQTKDNDRLLQYFTTSDGRDGMYFPMATKLAAIAEHYGFDGWLINIEKPFTRGQWDANILEAFLRQLRHELGPNRRLVWYDAITTANKVSYQNALTKDNLEFSKACGTILTNYEWTENGASSSKQLAYKSDMSPREVFFGIDVWAQSSKDRKTYGGGGTNTGIAVMELARRGLSATVFAPAWTFEHFPGRGRTMEKAVWDGLVPPADLDCSCGKANQHHPYNRGYPIVRSARQFPAGSESFFYTDFTRGFGRNREEEGRILYDHKTLHSQLGSQSPLPHMARTSVTDDQVESAINVLSQRFEELPGRTHLVVEVESFMPLGAVTHKTYERELPLFQLDMPADGSLYSVVHLKPTPSHPGSLASFYFKYNNDTSFFPLEDEIRCTVVPDLEGDNTRLLEVGIHFKGPQVPQQKFPIAEIVDISIYPRSGFREGTCSIQDLRVKRRHNGETEHWRLCWDYSDEDGALNTTTGIPYSKTTGPFAHFLVEVDGISAIAFALEWILCEALVEVMGGEGAEVKVVGVGFDGRRLAECRARLCI